MGKPRPAELEAAPLSPGSFLGRNAWPLAVTAFVLAAWVVVMLELLARRPPDVGYVATPPEVVAAMVELAGVKDGDVVYDLGCGDGRLAIAAALRGPNVRGVGIDIDPDRVAEAREAAARAGVGDRLAFRRADIFRQDLRPASVVMMYLTTSVNERLVPLLEKLPPGARIVSYTYSIPGVKSTKDVQVRSADGVNHRILLWVTPLEKE